jgi:hypothetical protein
MIDAADVSLRHTRIDINQTLALFACLLLALTGALAGIAASIQRLPSRSSLLRLFAFDSLTSQRASKQSTTGSIMETCSQVRNVDLQPNL